jgi:hypothetical protein
VGLEEVVVWKGMIPSWVSRMILIQELLCFFDGEIVNVVVQPCRKWEQEIDRSKAGCEIINNIVDE